MSNNKSSIFVYPSEPEFIPKSPIPVLSEFCFKFASILTIILEMSGKKVEMSGGKVEMSREN